MVSWHDWHVGHMAFASDGANPGGFSEQSTHVGSFFPSRGAATDDWGDAADSLGRPTPAMAATSGLGVC